MVSFVPSAGAGHFCREVDPSLVPFRGLCSLSQPGAHSPQHVGLVPGGAACLFHAKWRTVAQDFVTLRFGCSETIQGRAEPAECTG